ncbi:MAG TPA: NAD-dependent epimerase/dehydratase family protein [Verrucomicrobiota bacterium]|nr:NAD-dependent epimerase/dehydratase family protein [Verrucomicrobiota bacterium]HNU49584.1 NAD-dependent epimerase/dehydratase family protein [Verrucomicrobiota bacterium]
MRVLVTGATGFVGSHVVDRLAARECPTVILLRQTSSRRFLEAHHGRLEVHEGSLQDPATLDAAVAGVTHVVHCAGLTRALHRTDFDAVNHRGTVRLLDALRRHATGLERFVLVSSLAAHGPASNTLPARETDPPRPVSAYGSSKLHAEEAVRTQCPSGFVILRPPAVYGPRDLEFLRLFRAAQTGLVPSIGGGRQELTLVYAPDLAEALVHCLTHPAAAGKTYHVGAPEVVTAANLAREIGAVLGRRPRFLPIPAPLVPLVCQIAALGARCRRRPSLLAHDKHRELLALGWVADTTRLEAETGFSCPTRLRPGLEHTAAWYRAHRWIP